MSTFHKPVLLNKVIELFEIKENNKYIDATLGGGGHSLKILENGGRVLGIDQDRDALEYAQKVLTDYKDKIIFAKGNFKDIYQIAEQNDFKKVSGVLFDLGVSTYQLKEPKRGFSFREEGPLDMRMDKETIGCAFDIINNCSFEELYSIFLKYGEESLAKPITIAIVRERSADKIKTTKELADIINQVYQKYNKNVKHNPATKIFQALRIVVNHELDSLRTGIEQAIKLLDKKGRIIVISYHSLEDRIVKLAFRKSGLKILTKKPITADSDEIFSNKSARSAKLRVIENIC